MKKLDWTDVAVLVAMVLTGLCIWITVRVTSGMF